MSLCLVLPRAQDRVPASEDPGPNSVGWVSVACDAQPTISLVNYATSSADPPYLHFAAFSAIYLVVAWLLLRERGGIFLGFVIFATGTAALNFFYITYFRQRAADDRRAPGKK